MRLRDALLRRPAAAWLVAQYLAIAAPLTTLIVFAEVFDAWGPIGILPAYLLLPIPFVVAAAYGSWLASIAPALLERIAVPWHALAWPVLTFGALYFAVWAMVSGPPVASGPTTVAAVWLPAILLPGLATLTHGAYVVSRLFRAARRRRTTTGRPASLVTRVLVEAAHAASLLLLGMTYAIVVVAITFATLAGSGE